MIKIVVSIDEGESYKGKVPVFVQIPAGMVIPIELQEFMETVRDKYLFVVNQELTEQERAFFTSEASNI